MLGRISIGGALLAIALAPAGAAEPASHSHKAYVRLAACSPTDFTAAFYGRMYRVPGSQAMWMRFTLLERAGGPSFRRLRVPALAHWRKSHSDKPGFGYRQVVLHLAKGADYRVRAEFRWYDAAGRLLRRERRRSGLCRISGPRPNLRVRVLRRESTSLPGVERYLVRVADTGSAPAEDVPVRLTVDRGEVNTKVVADLAVGEASVLAFRGPECRSEVTAEVDPEDRIAESVEEDNVHVVSCAEVLR
jgi:hypothetical protein